MLFVAGLRGARERPRACTLLRRATVRSAKNAATMTPISTASMRSKHDRDDGGQRRT